MYRVVEIVSKVGWDFRNAVFEDRDTDIVC